MTLPTSPAAIARRRLHLRRLADLALGVLLAFALVGILATYSSMSAFGQVFSVLLVALFLSGLWAVIRRLQQ